MNILITGTSKGIGKACALYFLDKGHVVYGIDLNPSSITNDNYHHYKLDIRNEENYPQLPEIEVLVNNAGVQNKDDIDVNLIGTMRITEHYGIQPSIRSIVMIGSASGHTGSEFPAYCASKGGILAYTRNVALRIARYQATCNSLDFGGVLTELNKPVMDDPILWNEIMKLTPLKRWMTLDEVAQWIYFMACVNRFCTGQNILIDGLEAGNAKFIWPEEN